MTDPFQDPLPLKDKRVLVVEDEAIVAMLLEDMLSDLGCVPVGPAMTLKQGTELAQREVIDAAILDVNVAGERVYPIAEILAVRNVPVIFATGYGEGGLQDLWRGRPTVQKPYTEGDIVRALLAVFDGAGSTDGARNADGAGHADGAGRPDGATRADGTGRARGADGAASIDSK